MAEPVCRADPGDAERLARLRWEFRAAEDPAVEAETHAYVTNMYVQPDHRGRGLGTALLGAALTWAREQGVDSAILWPTDDSRSLYRRAGFGPSDALFELEL